MNKPYTCVFLFFAFGSFFLSAQGRVKNTSGVNSAFSGMLEKLSPIVEENTSTMAISADAYIGKIFPSLPPHFSAGLSASATFVDASFISDGINVMLKEIKDSMDHIGGSVEFDFSIPQKLPIPTFSAKARLGGLFLPFDIGLFALASGEGTFKFSMTGLDFSIDYACFGAELRYALMQGNLLLPQVSLGMGYVFQKQGVHFNAQKPVSSPGNTGSLSTGVSLSLNTNTFYATAQVSKRLAFLTPFAGGRAIFTQNERSYDWHYTTTLNGANVPDASDSSSGSDSTPFDLRNTGAQLFGGFSLTLGVFETTFAVQWNAISGKFSGALTAGVRF